MKEKILKPNSEDEFWTTENCFILESSNSVNDPEVSIARARVAVGQKTKWHRVKGTVERYYIMDGIGLVEIGELPAEKVTPGDVVLIPPSCRQRIKNIGDRDLIFLAICSPRFKEQAYEELE